MLFRKSLSILLSVTMLIGCFALGQSDAEAKPSKPWDEYCYCTINNCPNVSEGHSSVPCAWFTGTVTCDCTKDTYYVFLSDNPKQRTCDRNQKGIDAGLGCGDCDYNTAPTSCFKSSHKCLTNCETRKFVRPNPNPCQGLSIGHCTSGEFVCYRVGENE